MSALAMVLMAVVGWQAGILIRHQWDEPMSTLDISIGFFMLPVVVAAVHSLLHLLVGIIEGGPATPPLEAE
jgi:TRAP-type transport system small permease protein